MIDKDQVPILCAIIKTSYAPVLKRAMVNNVLLGMEQVRIDNFPGNSNDFMKMLEGPKGFKVLRQIMNSVYDARHEMVLELMKQYGIITDKDAFGLYYAEFVMWFNLHFDEISTLVYSLRFNELVAMTEVKG